MSERLKQLAGAVTFQGATYRAVAHDTRAMVPSLIVIVLAYALVGVVEGYHLVVEQNPEPAYAVVSMGMRVGYQMLTALSLWVLGGALNAILASQVFKGTIEVGQMMRIYGYAGVFRVLSVIPFTSVTFAGISVSLGYLLTLVGNGVGLRATARISALHAALVALLSGIIMFVLLIGINYMQNLLFYTLELPY